MAEFLDDPRLIGALLFFGVWLVVMILTNAWITSSGPSAMLTPLIAGYWFARKWFHARRVLDKVEAVTPEETVYAPYAREYNVELQECFTVVRAVLEETLYDVSDRWHIIHADTEAKRITAGMHITGHEPDRGYLGLEVNFEDTASGTTIIRFVFDHRYRRYPFENMVRKIFTSIKTDMAERAGDIQVRIIEKLGQGTKLIPAKENREYYKWEYAQVPTPSWNLLTVTGIGLGLLIMDILAQFLRQVL